LALPSEFPDVQPEHLFGIIEIKNTFCVAPCIRCPGIKIGNAFRERQFFLVEPLVFVIKDPVPLLEDSLARRGGHVCSREIDAALPSNVYCFPFRRAVPTTQ
jgi:hypothetical protein